jgi:uncharacterized 2Fe-2S/4Fe-4S cluster protein (DUF4445 family)
MSGTATIRLEPLGVSFTAPLGTPLQDLLFAHGVEFPCGGTGRCKGCRVRVLTGSLPVTPEQEAMLSAEELRAGWRLSCQCAATGDLTLEMAQWESAILSDESPIHITPRAGLGIAVDLGTTTVVSQLLDLQTGNVLGVRAALNAQARRGSDIMSRIGYAASGEGREELTAVIRRQIGGMIEDLLEGTGRGRERLDGCVLVGNTVMHHLFSGLDVTPLSCVPFESPTCGSQNFSSLDLGWRPAPFPVRFLPAIGGFVGSDILAGIVARGMHEKEETTALIDLGTNGELVFGNRDRLICASTAAGPAFEGARIHMGMRASTGAISAVTVVDGTLRCHVLGNVTPRGICGSGLVDAVAGALELGLIAPGGRITGSEKALPLLPPVRLSQTDIRELQLAKGAIAAGSTILLETLARTPEEIHHVFLAGAFGNYINIGSAQAIGLLRFPQERIVPSGNTALRGAKLALFTEPGFWDALALRIEHCSLHEHPRFQEIYVEEMTFPGFRSF